MISWPALRSDSTHLASALLTAGVGVTMPSFQMTPKRSFVGNRTRLHGIGSTFGSLFQGSESTTLLANTSSPERVLAIGPADRVEALA